MAPFWDPHQSFLRSFFHGFLHVVPNVHVHVHVGCVRPCACAWGGVLERPESGARAAKSERRLWASSCRGGEEPRLAEASDDEVRQGLEGTKELRPLKRLMRLEDAQLENLRVRTGARSGYARRCWHQATSMQWKHVRRCLGCRRIVESMLLKLVAASSHFGRQVRNC